MARISEGKLLEFLLHRKFPGYRARQSPPGLSQYQSREVEAYLKQLEALPDDELKKRYAEEMQKEREELEAKRAAVEQSRFFNARHSRADFSHWAKATYWTLEEAIALSFGKSPNVVSWKKLEQYEEVSPFAAKYAKVRNLATRAKNWKQLYDPVHPGIFLAWAKRNDIGFPEELEELVTKYGQNIGDWKTAYETLKEAFDTLKAQFDELADKTKQISAERDERISALVEERDSLLDQVAELRASGKPLNPKERESLLKLVIGMAIKGYSYDPNMSRSPTAKKIADDLSEIGLSIDEDTVRKWLKEAAEIVPGDIELD